MIRNRGYADGQYVCDVCGKVVGRFESFQLVKRWYEPGPKHDKVSSDIIANQYKIMDVCPECMRKFEKRYRRT